MSAGPVRRGAIAALLSSLALTALILCGGGFGREVRACKPHSDLNGGQQSCADAYTKFVRAQFIYHGGRLVVRKDVDPNSGVPVVDLAPAIYDGRDPQAWTFANQSFLLEDIRRNDPSIWLIENGRVKDINPGAHITPSPFSDHKAWRGSILFRRPPEAPQQRDVVLQPRGWTGPTLRLTENRGDLSTGDRRITRLNLDTAHVGEIAAPAFDIYCSASDILPAAKVRRIGDQAGVWSSSVRGCTAIVGPNALGQNAFDAIGRGDRLAIATGDRAYVFDRVEPKAGEVALSASTPSGDRVRDSSAPWWSIAIEHDYLRASLGRRSDASLKHNLRTTLDPVMQPEIQKMLDEFVTAHPGDGSVPLKIAAVTVMNAKTGEVLAMGTWPHVAPTDHDVVDLDDPTAKAARLNQNLQLLPIGSTAKPLLAAAILTEQPNLINARLPRHLKATEILGMPVTPLSGEAEGGLLDFDGFLEHSDNVYAAQFLLLGSRDRGNATCIIPASDRYYIGAISLMVRPKSVFEIADADGTCRRAPPQSLRQLRWADTLATLFDVNVSAHGSHDGRYATRCGDADSDAAPGGGYGDDLHEASGWRSLFEDRPMLDSCKFTESAPVREALAINAAQDFRSELLPIMLGNGEGRWTAVKLAESYSRLVTGRRVFASFAVGKPRSYPALDPRFTMRARLTHALTLVPQGTALQTELPKALDALDTQVRSAGLTPGFFAKTGTPVAIKAEYLPVDKSINLLISQERLRYLAASKTVLLGRQSGAVALTANSDAATINRAAQMLSQDTVFTEAKARFGVRPNAVVAALVQYLGEIDKGKSPFVIQHTGDGSLLIRVGARRDDNGNLGDEDQPHGKLLVLVAVAYDPNRRDAHGAMLEIDPKSRRAANAAMEPVRAYTIVVSIQYPIKGRTNVAADLAAEVAQRFFGNYLARGGS